MKLTSVNSIIFGFNNNPLNVNNHAQKRPVRIIPSLACDTVSFGAMKKSEFESLELAVVEKYKLPIEKFNSKKDLAKYSQKGLESLQTLPLKGKSSDTENLRKQILTEWRKFFKNNSEKYPAYIAFLVMKGLYENLKEDNDRLPPQLDVGVLDKTLEKIKVGFEKDKHFSYGFSNMYRKNLTEEMLENSFAAKEKTGWILIPSKSHAPENFAQNVERLRALSYSTWCTANTAGKHHLELGDFHFYVVDGVTQVVLRMFDGKVAEIEGIKNDWSIPPKFLDEITSYMKEVKLQPNDDVKVKMQEAIRKKEDRIKRINNFKELFKNADKNNPLEVFPLLGIEVEVLTNGKLELSEYAPPEKDISFKDVGLDEYKLFENVEKICGDADFSNSDLKEFSTLKYIEGDANFSNSNIKNLGSLLEIQGNANFNQSRVKDFGSLRFAGACDFSGCYIDSLNNLTSIAGRANFEGATIRDLGNLKYTDDCNFHNAKIRSLCKLEQINGHANFTDSKIEDLGNLTYIQGNATFSNSRIKSLKKLEEIGGNADFSNSHVNDLENLQRIGGEAIFGSSDVVSLKKLKSIGGDVDFTNSIVEDLGELYFIGGSTTLTGSCLSREMIVKIVNIAKDSKSDKNR